MSVIHHEIKRSKANDNLAEKQFHETVTADFAGVYYAGSGVPHVSVTIEISKHYETTIRKTYGYIDLSKDDIVELRSHLKELLDNPNWSK